jgi:hypothetical protein
MFRGNGRRPLGWAWWVTGIRGRRWGGVERFSGFPGIPSGMQCELFLMKKHLADWILPGGNWRPALRMTYVEGAAGDVPEWRKTIKGCKYGYPTLAAKIRRGGRRGWGTRHPAVKQGGGVALRGGLGLSIIKGGRTLKG